ncbi:sensor histidine kinase [Actinosynnema mirum]|uniref:histidine kinase n=1 Tax=Actinosynnema mirum (strain ATCC 29888 / DSM 43827 / JCM 3225 / NBRC 14064 / NCIMB 13271 / NRRL B-12336 / IMRU 3971 / 101) TaxID=446462 RepID=C6WLG4_ACTMD|nr:HAMP domain-containing sensor histidine kinase [Actinosynnema mirum]ACU38357.1 histidine kinase [Actinosynnema mirum DSM 43827]
MARPPGLSVRLRLTLSYAALLLVTGAVLLAVVWLYLLRYVPDNDQGLLGVSPNRYLLVGMFGPAAAVALAVLLLFGLVGGWFLAGRVLAPLTRLADAARAVAGGSLSHRVRLPGRADEFRELADLFDAMLDQLEAHVAEQRRFAANASHELRTPLAITQALLDVAHDDPAWDRGEALARLRTANRRAIDLTEALLLLARGDSGNLAREPVDLSLLAEEAAETLLPLAERRGTALDVTGGAAVVDGSAELLLRVVLNLVQNAVAHNLPANSGGRVLVRTGERGGAGVLEVENTGPLLPPELVPTLTEPFQRGARRARADEHAGVGLGLAIVRSVVRAHGGTLRLVARPGGGLRVTVALPLAAASGRAPTSGGTPGRPAPRRSR